MTKILRVLVILCAFLGLEPSLVWAEQTPVKISTSYNHDSDGASYISYSIATEKKNKPWNFSYSNTSIRQRDFAGSLSEQRFITRWQQRINEE